MLMENQKQQVDINFGTSHDVAHDVSHDVTDPVHVSANPMHVSTGLVQDGTADVAHGSNMVQVSADLTQPTSGVLEVHLSGPQVGTQVVLSPDGQANEAVQKKRGRPRKYGLDGSVVHRPQAAALSPMPISASIPLTGDYPAWKPSKGRSVDSFKKKHKVFQFDSPGGDTRVAYSDGPNLTPHVITVNPGEDVHMKVISFSQQGSRAICILSANGCVSNVTLRQPDSSGGTLTYEGRFEILSLTGSFTPIETGGTKSRTGGMSVSLAGPDGRVLGGGLAGLLVAAGPVQVVIGSFLAGQHQQEQKPKKQRLDHNTTIYAPSPLNHHSAEAIRGPYGGHHTISSSNVHNLNHLSSDNVINFQGSESNDTNGSHKFDISC